jgi:hypothetical protein
MLPGSWSTCNVVLSLCNRSRAGDVSVILSAAKDFRRIALLCEIIRCAQDNDFPVND